MASACAISQALGWFDRAERSIGPARPFVVGPRPLTYGALIDRTRRLSALFRELGLLRDDRAVIATDDDGAAITIFLALLRAGITAVVLDPQASRPELETLIRAADAKALFVDERVIARGGFETSKRADAALIPIGKGAMRPSLLRRLTRAGPTRWWWGTAATRRCASARWAATPAAGRTPGRRR